LLKPALDPKGASPSSGGMPPSLRSIARCCVLPSAKSAVLLLMALACRGAAQTVDCTVDPDNMLCCELERDNVCIFKSIISARSGCSAACKRRFQTLGWDCWNTNQMHYRWQQMKANCDAQNLVQFTSTTKYAPPANSRSSNVGTVGSCHIPTKYGMSLIPMLITGFLVVLG